ncbi:MAG TPA: rRNA maturation RNase YbeY [Mycobacteriales bacterium]|nr:rRNA maturation RNase YbeY [Mycobacteriales bacterium]
MPIEIANESGECVDAPVLAALAEHVLAAMGVHPLAELSVLLVERAAMAELHVRWMGEPGATDVLAFPMDELHPGRGDALHPPEPGLLGDVVLCPAVAREQARTAGDSPTDELHLLCTHGILHLLGYDHGEPDEEQEMFALQAQLLRSWRQSGSGAGGRAAGRG